VNGVLQVNAKIPENLVGSGELPVAIHAGSAESQSGVTVWVAGEKPSSADGVGPLIDQKLDELRRDDSTPPLSEFPNDEAIVPADWLAIVSWNIQVGGTSPDSTTRPPMVKAALSKLFSGTYQLLAAQEIPSTTTADLLRTLLPGGSTVWQQSFFDTADSMDNGVWYRGGILLKDSTPLFVTQQQDSTGRFIPDHNRTTHPPQVGHFQVGDFDFTLITLHLTFADGNTAESARELGSVLDYLDWYFNQPDHDPDVVICGDFNVPSTLSGTTGRNGITLDSVIGKDPRFQIGERRFVVTVHQPTSRSSAASGGVPANNYDHCVLSADTMEEFVQARRVSLDILTANPEDPEIRLTSDHFPIVALFKTRGPGISPDLRTRIKP
jgi:endonuclease/exonuclease/phosphatase family metal-dependent hydrolase